MGKGGGGIEAGHGELFFSRTYDFPGACLVRQAGRGGRTRKSHELGLGALYDYVTGQLAIPPGRLAPRPRPHGPPAGPVAAHEGAGLANGTASPGLAAVRAYLAAQPTAIRRRYRSGLRRAGCQRRPRRGGGAPSSRQATSRRSSTPPSARASATETASSSSRRSTPR